MYDPEEHVHFDATWFEKQLVQIVFSPYSIGYRISAADGEDATFEEIIRRLHIWHKKFPEDFVYPPRFDWWTRDDLVPLLGNDRQPFPRDHPLHEAVSPRKIGAPKIQDEDCPLWDLARWVFGLKRGLFEISADVWHQEIKQAQDQQEDPYYWHYKDDDGNIIVSEFPLKVLKNTYQNRNYPTEVYRGYGTSTKGGPNLLAREGLGDANASVIGQDAFVAPANPDNLSTAEERENQRQARGQERSYKKRLGKLRARVREIVREEKKRANSKNKKWTFGWDEVNLDIMSGLDQIQAVMSLFGRDDEFAQMQAEFYEAELSDYMSRSTKDQSDQVPERDFKEVMRENKFATRSPRSRKIDTSKWKF